MTAAILALLLAAPKCPATAAFPAPNSCHYVVTDAGVDPDPQCTSGEADDTLTWQQLCSEGQSRRCADNPAVAKAYGVDTKLLRKQGKPHGEDDHWWSLCAGGTNGPRNRWQQPAPDYTHKDVVEAAACRAICAPEIACAAECSDDDKACLDKCPRRLSPEGARAMISEWRRNYQLLKAVPKPIKEDVQ
jgi:hypothetical protein